MGSTRSRGAPSRGPRSPGGASSQWAYAAGGLDLSPIYFLTVQGDTADSVVLHGLSVVGVEPVEPPEDVVSFNTCAGGGDVFPRRFEVEVSAERGSVVPRVGDIDIPGDELDPAPAFPYQVSSSDPEVFWLNVRSSCYCEWRLRLDWTSGSTEGSTEVTLGGEPFRTAPNPGHADAPEEGYQVQPEGTVTGPS